MGISETREFFRTLNQLQHALPLEAGSSSSSAHENVFLSVVAGLYEDNPSRHLVTLGWGLPPRAAVRDLPCAVLSEDGERVVSAHRTNGLGQFQVNLEPGRYSLHFVIEVRSPIDIEALLRLADEPALEFLRDCLVDEQTPAELRSQIQARLDEQQAARRMTAAIGELLTAFREGGPEATLAAVARIPWTEESTSVPTPAGILMAKSVRQPGGAGPPTAQPPDLPAIHAPRAEGTRPPAAQPPGLSIIEVVRDVLTIRQLARDVPFGVVRVLAKGKSRGMLLGTRLLAMPEYQTAGGEAFCSAEIRLNEVKGIETDPQGIDYYVVAATPATFAWFPAEEVEEFRSLSPVADDSKLRQKVSQLISELKP